MTEQELAAFKAKLVYQLDTTTNEEAQLISNIVDSGSAGALPAVSNTDNGKVLTVANGAWVAGEASGGGVMMTGTWDEGVCTFDMTYQEIYDAVVGGQMVAVKIVGGNDYYVGFVSQIGVASGSINAKIISAGNTISCYGESANDYPSFED